MSDCVLWYFYNISNKEVEGSGSEGDPKYMGEGVTYRVFVGVLIAFSHTCVLYDVLSQVACTISYDVMT